MRAATAVIERATSSESEITREDFTPAAGSNSYSVTTGPGTHRDDAALDAEIGEHGFEHARVLFQRLVGERRALSLHMHRLGQQAERRQLIFARGEIERGLLARAWSCVCAVLRASSRLMRRLAALGKPRRRDRLGRDVERVAVIVVVESSLSGSIVLVVVVVVGSRRASFGSFDLAAQPIDRRGTIADARAAIAREAQARREEGERQARDQKQQRQRGADPGLAVDLAGVLRERRGARCRSSRRRRRAATAGARKHAEPGRDAARCRAARRSARQIAWLIAACPSARARPTPRAAR